jgi:uncharacterized protein with HEPN domain
MPQRDPGVYLEDIEHYAAAAVRFTSGFSLEKYLADEKTSLEASTSKAAIPARFCFFIRTGPWDNPE